MHIGSCSLRPNQSLEATATGIAAWPRDGQLYPPPRGQAASRRLRLNSHVRHHTKNQSAMPPKYVKTERGSLRKFEVDERWLQDRIAEDPSILGLGELTVLRRERKQTTGGRIDFLLSDPEEDVRYEVEVMLGRLNESHIIRAIEYWDVERSRYPEVEHRAVIVAEDITNRFFNVIALLNRAIPIIAIQMTAVKLEDQFSLVFTKVLDIADLRPTDEEPQGEQKDRAYWQTNSGKASLASVDALIALLPQGIAPRVTYNQGHIAVGTSGVNFLWAYPRKTAAHCFFNLRIDGDERESWITRLSDAGIFAGPRRDLMKLRVNQSEIQQNALLLRELLASVERLSSRAV